MLIVNRISINFNPIQSNSIANHLQHRSTQFNQTQSQSIQPNSIIFNTTKFNISKYNRREFHQFPPRNQLQLIISNKESSFTSQRKLLLRSTPTSKNTTFPLQRGVIPLCLPSGRGGGAGQIPREEEIKFFVEDFRTKSWFLIRPRRQRPTG